MTQKSKTSSFTAGEEKTFGPVLLHEKQLIFNNLSRNLIS